MGDKALQASIRLGKNSHVTSWNEFSKRLVHALQVRNLNQSELARKIGVKPGKPPLKWDNS